MVKGMVIDTHAHLGQSSAFSMPDRDEKLIKATPEDMIKIMDAQGIDKAIVSPMSGYEHAEGIKDTERQNDNIIAAVMKYPDRFPCGLAHLHLLHGQRNLHELNRIVQEPSLKGLMFHTYHDGVAINHPMMFSILEMARRYKGFIVSIHTWIDPEKECVWMFEEVAEAFPEITFINALSGYTWSHLQESLKVAKRLDNVFINMTLWIKEYRPVEKAVKEIGASRILYGSDNPYFGMDEPLDLIQIRKSHITDDEKESILWKNAARLFNVHL
jgi:hypothetical protein